MFLSIIIPFHKGIHFLKDALTSILRSKIEEEYEVVLVDASDEDVQGLLGMFEELPVKRIVAEKAEVVSCRNQGLKESSGTYVYFMDADDYVTPTSFGALIKCAKRADDNIQVIAGSMDESWFKYETYMSDGNFLENERWADALERFDFPIVHKLIRREVLGETPFDEELSIYSHIPVVAKMFVDETTVAFVSEAIYVKRRHNDEIQYPSLSQISFPGKAEVHAKAYQRALAVTNNDLVIRLIMTVRKREAKSNKRAKRMQQLKNFFTRPTFLYRMIDKFIFRRLSMKEDWVVFESFLGKNYSDSCKYIYRYLQENEPQYKCIWVINDKKTMIDGSCKKVKYLSLRWFYYTTRAKYYVNNMRQPIWMNRRPGSVLLETWHGTPLKKLVFDMEDIHAATPTYKMDMYKQSRSWTYLIADNPFSTETFERCFLYPREQIIETGYPRNDILVAEDLDEKVAMYKKELGIPLDKKVILYAPTWRDDEYYGPGEYQFALKLDLKRMRERLGDEYVILLRTHYFIADAIDTTGMEGFAYNVSRYNDIAELYAISDICMTDYSSVFFDYANLKRPLLFYVYDFDKYKDQLRGFYIDMENELPGPLLYTEDEVLDAIENIEDVQEKYREKYEEFHKRFCCHTDGHAAERVWNLVKC